MKRQKSTSFFWYLGFGIIIASLTSCAHVVDIEACRTTPPAGFLDGLWHGIIAPISFIVSLFDNTVAIYDVNNNGSWYDLGFVLGSGILFGGGSRATK
jgi:hypothetical protein